MRRSITAAAALALAVALSCSGAMAQARDSKLDYRVDLTASASVSPTQKPVKAKQAKTPAAFVMSEQTPVEASCRAKAPGTDFNSVHEYTCAYQLFRAFSMVLADPAKRAEFDKLWAPEVVKNASELKMDGVSDEERKANTFALIRRMRDFTHERFDFVQNPTQAKQRDEAIKHPTLQGGIGAILRLKDDWQIRQAIFGDAPEGKIAIGEYQKKLDEGMVITPGHEMLIDATVPGSPAYGVLKGGDVLVAVIDQNGEHPLAGMKQSDAIKLIRGDLGSSVTLKVLRTNSAGRQIPLQFTIQRVQVQQRALYIHDENGIRHITVENFENDYLLDDFYNALAEAQKLGMKGVDIDLRGNPGGRMDYVVGMLQMVVPRGLLLRANQRTPGADGIIQTEWSVADGYGVTAVKKVGEPDSAKQLDVNPRVPYTAQYGQEAMRNPELVYERPLALAIDENMPVTVEVNVESYSASEIFAGAIKATHRGTVIGAPSAGKGAIMPEISLPEGGALDVTNGQFFPGGLDTKHKGVIPDVIVEESKDYGKTDPQRDAATRVLLDQAKRLEEVRKLETDRTKINDARFEDDMAKRDANDLKPPKDQDRQYQQ